MNQDHSSNQPSSSPLKRQSISLFLSQEKEELFDHLNSQADTNPLSLFNSERTKENTNEQFISIKHTVTNQSYKRLMTNTLCFALNSNDKANQIEAESSPMKDSTNLGKFKKKLSIIILPKLPQAEPQSKPKGILSINSLNNNAIERRKRLPTVERIELEMQNHLKKIKHLIRKDTLKTKKSICLNELYESTDKLDKEELLAKFKKHSYRNSKLSHQQAIPEEGIKEALQNEKIKVKDGNNAKQIDKKAIKIIGSEDYRDNWLFKTKFSYGNYLYKQNKHEMTQTETQIKFLRKKIDNTFSLLQQEIDDTVFYYQNKENFY